MQKAVIGVDRIAGETEQGRYPRNPSALLHRHAGSHGKQLVHIDKNEKGVTRAMRNRLWRVACAVAPAANRCWQQSPSKFNGPLDFKVPGYPPSNETAATKANITQ
nr:hypothetical protein FFPRI1PSEUD_38010 [Pseudomonas sp. FFPRI_1]